MSGEAANEAPERPPLVGWGDAVLAFLGTMAVLWFAPVICVRLSAEDACDWRSCDGAPSFVVLLFGLFTAPVYGIAVVLGLLLTRDRLRRSESPDACGVTSALITAAMAIPVMCCVGKAMV